MINITITDQSFYYLAAAFGIVGVSWAVAWVLSKL